MVIKLEKLTDEELSDFIQRACVQLCPELAQQLMSVVVELIGYRAKEESFEFKLSEDS
jgi:hypothetical protein